MALDYIRHDRNRETEVSQNPGRGSVARRALASPTGAVRRT